jgi:hypothetical protein
MSYEDIGKKVGHLVFQKQIQYGNSFGTCHKFLELLYPYGMTPEHYPEMLTMVRVFDKLMRVAKGNQGDENAWQDICGYALLELGRQRGDGTQ